MAARQSEKVSRRRFLRRAVQAGAAAIAAPYFVPRHVLGGAGQIAANDRIDLGIIGVGVRGKYLIGNLPDEGRVVALCDCYLPRVKSAQQPSGEFAAPLARFRDGDGPKCTVYQDYRRLIDEQKLDAVMIATPDHHHVLAALLALQAGRDVYLEKPLTLTIAEGRTLVRAVKKYDRVLQVGSQQRSMEINRFACDFLRRGGLGPITRVDLPNYPGPMRYDDSAEEPVPDGLDWEMFSGPASKRPHNRRLWVKEEFKVGDLLWRGWDLYRDYSGHLMTNWGAHSIDMVQLALGTDHTAPAEIWPETKQMKQTLGSQWVSKTPPPGSREDRVSRMRLCPVTMRYAGGVELRFTDDVEDWTFHGERGKLLMARNTFRTEPEGIVTDGPDVREETNRWAGAGHVARPHIQNWLDCIKSRQTPHAPVEAGHRTVSVCHLAAIARELGRQLKWDPVAEQFPGDDQANALLDRPRRKGFELPVV